MKKSTDSEIIELYWNRDESAIRETETKYGNYCFAVANNILENREDAEECISDTWLTAWNTIPPKRPKLLKLFLAKITRRNAFDKYRHDTAAKRGGGEITQSLDELADCLPAPSNVEMELSEQAMKTCINAFLVSLPERDADVFLRRYFYVESVSEIAKRYFIRTDMLSELVTDNLKMVTRYAKDHEGRFLTQLQSQCQTNSAKERSVLQRQIEKSKARVKELDLFIKRLYEDNVTGKISDERYVMMMTDYEAEQKELTEKIADMERDIRLALETDRGIDKFAEIVKKNLDFSELTPAILREFVDKIVVHEPVKIDGKRHQTVDIYYSFVGRFDLPAAG